MKGIPIPISELEARWLEEHFKTDTPGALKAGTRIEKINSDGTDGHSDGALGLVMKSICLEGKFAYIVRWDDQVEQPVLITGNRIQEVS